MSTPFRQGRYEDLPATPRVPHPYFSLPTRTVTVHTRELGALDAHVVVAGSGPPLLLVHGLMTSSYSWRYVIEPLSRSFTVYAPDLPGAGRSQAPAAPLTPAAMTAWLSALIDALGVRGCAAIGNSMGGYLTLRLALADPTAMSRLVVVHAPGVPELRILALSTVMAMPGARALLRWLVQRDPHRWAHRNVHYWDESLKSLEEARAYGDPLATEGGLRAFASYLGDTLAWGPMRWFQAELMARASRGAAFPVPLLLLYARRDPMVPPRFGAVYAERIPSATLVWLDEGSHFAHVDAIDRFLPPVSAFLA
jgi:pimeloyl-ACP methyl ester carboxylesterase